MATAPNRVMILDFYRNTVADPSGNGEGQVYIGNTAVTTDSAGNAIFGFGVSGTFPGQHFTATATDQTGGDSSEFSPTRQSTSGTTVASLSGPSISTSNGFGFSLIVQTNQFYRVQSTTNLNANPVVWIDVTNILSALSPVQVTGPAVTNSSARFYRLVSP